METANRCDLRDYPHNHDHPGQDAGQLPRDRVFHHRHSGDQRAPPTTAIRTTPGKYRPLKSVCPTQDACGGVTPAMSAIPPPTAERALNNSNPKRILASLLMATLYCPHQVDPR